MNKKVSEEDILMVFVGVMGARGENRKLVRLDVDIGMLERINRAKGSNIDLGQLHRIADRCLANEWLEHTTISAGKYGDLSLTTTGLGIVRSRQRKEEANTNRSWLKKLSDYIENHKGFFMLLGAVVAISGLLLKLFAG